MAKTYSEHQRWSFCRVGPNTNTSSSDLTDFILVHHTTQLALYVDLDSHHVIKLGSRTCDSIKKEIYESMMKGSKAQLNKKVFENMKESQARMNREIYENMKESKAQFNRKVYERLKESSAQGSGDYCRRCFYTWTYRRETREIVNIGSDLALTSSTNFDVIFAREKLPFSSFHQKKRYEKDPKLQMWNIEVKNIWS